MSEMERPVGSFDRQDVMIVSGGFDPIHPGHIEMFRDAKRHGGIVVAGVNSDDWLIRKKGKPFQIFFDRLKIVESMRSVDIAMGFNDEDNTAIDLIKRVQRMFPHLDGDRITFCNGGDRGVDNTPETEYCKQEGINLKFAVGGAKKWSSSSELLEDWVVHRNEYV